MGLNGNGRHLDPYGAAQPSRPTYPARGPFAPPPPSVPRRDTGADWSRFYALRGEVTTLSPRLRSVLREQATFEVPPANTYMSSEPKSVLAPPPEDRTPTNWNPSDATPVHRLGGMEGQMANLSDFLGAVLLGRAGKKKKGLPKILRGKRGNRIALIVGGPLAAVVRTIAVRSSTQKGGIKLPTKVAKALKKVPVIRNMPGIQKGVINPKDFLKFQTMFPAKAIAAELRKKKARKPPDLAAQAMQEQTDAIAADQNVSPAEVVATPELQQQALENTSQALASEQQILQGQVAESEQEQAIYESEMQQFVRRDVGPAPGARTSDEIVDEQADTVIEVMRHTGLPPTDENIDMVSGQVAEAWVEEHQDRLDEAKAEEELLLDEAVAAEEAQEGVEAALEEGLEFEPAETETEE